MLGCYHGPVEPAAEVWEDPCKCRGKKECSTAPGTENSYEDEVVEDKQDTQEDHMDESKQSSGRSSPNDEGRQHPEEKGQNASALQLAQTGICKIVQRQMDDMIPLFSCISIQSSIRNCISPSECS